VFAAFLEIQVVRPLSRLSGRIKLITPGDLEVPLDRVKHATPEIDELRSSIDDLKNKLKNARAQIITRTKLATLGHIAASMAHEIRNPLEAISGAVEILSSHMRLNKAGKKSLSIIKEEIANLDDFLGEFLEYTRIKPAHVVKTHILPIIKDCLLLLKPLLKKKSIQINFMPVKYLPCCKVDIRQIKRVFINIILNSIDAIINNGNIRIYSRKMKDYIEIEIQDNGSGINQENIEKVFDPYFTTKKTGFGMGLALSKKIIQQHGGTLAISSCPGMGTTVMLKIPSTDGR
jgi:signal transduction histidine kinase